MDLAGGLCCSYRVEVDIAELAALELGMIAIRSPDAQGTRISLFVFRTRRLPLENLLWLAHNV